MQIHSRVCLQSLCALRPHGRYSVLTFTHIHSKRKQHSALPYAGVYDCPSQWLAKTFISPSKIDRHRASMYVLGPHTVYCCSYSYTQPSNTRSLCLKVLGQRSRLHVNPIPTTSLCPRSVRGLRMLHLHPRSQLHIRCLHAWVLLARWLSPHGPHRGPLPLHRLGFQPRWQAVAQRASPYSFHKKEGQFQPFTLATLCHYSQQALTCRWPSSTCTLQRRRQLKARLKAGK